MIYLYKRPDSKTTINGVTMTTKSYLMDSHDQHSYANESRISKFTNYDTLTYNNMHNNRNTTATTMNPDFEKFLPLIKKRNIENVYASYNKLKYSHIYNQQQQPNHQNNKQNQQQSHIDNKMFQYFPKIKTAADNGMLKYDLSLFDTRIFKKIDFNEFLSETDSIKLIRINNNKEYAFDLGNNLILRSLKVDDFDRDYLELLQQLTVVGDDVTKEVFEERFFKMKSCLNTYYILVVEDLTLNKIVGTTTLVNEQKFIRHASSRARIEDVVVDDTYRGKKLGKLLIDMAIKIAKLLGCYKISLECKDELRSFYEKFGLQLEDKQNYLCRRF